MNPEAQLIASLKRLNQEALQGSVRYYYGQVISVDTGKDTCTVEVKEEGLKAEINLRVGQQALTSSFVIYPKVGSQLLFLSEDPNFGRAYMLTCSEVSEVKISGLFSLKNAENDTSLKQIIVGLATQMQNMIAEIRTMIVTTGTGPATITFQPPTPKPTTKNPTPETPTPTTLAEVFKGEKEALEKIEENINKILK